MVNVSVDFWFRLLQCVNIANQWQELAQMYNEEGKQKDKVQRDDILIVQESSSRLQRTASAVRGYYNIKFNVSCQPSQSSGIHRVDHPDIRLSVGSTVHFTVDGNFYQGSGDDVVT